MKLVIFDYDGVLMDSFEFHKKVYMKISDILNVEVPVKDELFRELLELDWRETYKKLDIISKDKVKLSEFTYHNYSSKYSGMIHPYPCIKEVLIELSKRYKLAIVSNGFKKDIMQMLKKHDLEYFSAVFTPENGILKPSPDLLNKCIKKFNVTADEAVFIGDMDGDITAGKAAGIKTIAVTYGFHLKHKLSEADFLINSPKEILTTLEGI